MTEDTREWDRDIMCDHCEQDPRECGNAMTDCMSDAREIAEEEKEEARRGK